MTLVEIMIAVAILAILSTMAAPAFQGMIASSQIRSATNDILATLAHARSEAIRRSATVTVSANGGDWSTGWTSVTGGTTLSTGRAMPDSVVIDNAITSISFTPNGQTTDTGTLSIASTQTEVTSIRDLQILGSGKAILVTRARP